MHYIKKLTHKMQKQCSTTISKWQRMWQLDLTHFKEMKGVRRVEHNFF